MKKNLSHGICKAWSLVIVMLLAVEAVAAELPAWVTTTPKAENGTYRFEVTTHTAATEEAAFNGAEIAAWQNALHALGVGMNTADLEEARKGGELKLKDVNFKIPLRVVCKHFEALPNGAVRAYLLCQVAFNGLVKPEYTEFTECGDMRSGEVDWAQVRPVEWAEYETDKYIAKLVKRSMTRGENKTFQDNLHNEVRSALEKALMTNDTLLTKDIEVKVQINDKTVGHAVAYVEKRIAVRYYKKRLGEELEHCRNFLDNADGHIRSNELADADASYQRILKKLRDMDAIFLFLGAHTDEDSYIDEKEEYDDIKQQTLDNRNLLGQIPQQLKIDKIHEYVKRAENGLDKSKNAIGDVLRHLYAAQLLLADLDFKTQSEVKLQLADGSEEYAKDYLPAKIQSVLTDVVVTCDGTMNDSEDELKLSFYYHGEPISNIGYKYNANDGWSANTKLINGWGQAFLPENNTPKQIHVLLDYQCEDEMQFDPELPLLFDKYQASYRYDQYADKTVPVVKKPISDNTNIMAHTHTSTDIHRNIVAKLVCEDNHRVSAADSMQMAKTIAAVCAAISKQQYTYDAKIFTPVGYKQFERLIKYGKARIITAEGYRFIRMGDEVQCRSIPMAFSFSHGTTQYENVAFTFKDNLIDGVQFTLEERAARSFMGFKNIDETARLTLINFMENYKTAFAMQNWNYIASIFSDDAIIITGRVVKKAENVVTDHAQAQFLNREEVVYERTSKKEYIARLKRTRKEWINIKFGDTKLEQSRNDDLYGISLAQDYFSNNYGDQGYLFLLIDTSDSEHPMIRVRAWQPDKHFTMNDYDKLVY